MEAKVKINYSNGTIEERTYASQEKYDKTNTVQFKMKLNKKTDSDIIEWLENQPNKQGAIKELIRKNL